MGEFLLAMEGVEHEEREAVQWPPNSVTGCLWDNTAVWASTGELVTDVELTCTNCAAVLKLPAGSQPTAVCPTCSKCPGCYRGRELQPPSPHPETLAEYDGAPDADPRLPGNETAMDEDSFQRERALGGLPTTLALERLYASHGCVWPHVPVGYTDGTLLRPLELVCANCSASQAFAAHNAITWPCLACQRCLGCSPGPWCQTHHACAFLCQLRNTPGSPAYQAHSFSDPCDFSPNNETPYHITIL